MTATDEPLFGRDTELARLADLLTRARQGYGAAVLVEGEPGSGKTTLVGALEAQARAAGCTVLRGCCDEAAVDFPLLPVLDALGVHRRGEDVARAEIRQLLRVGAGANQDAIPALVERLLDLVETACAAGPVVLTVDDLQWADDTSAVWWQRLARCAGELPLLLIGAVRTRADSPTVDALRRSHTRRQGPTLRLGPLAPAALTALATHRLGAAPGPRLSRLLLATGGSPLCAVEILAHVGRENLLQPGADGQALDLTKELAGATLAGAVRNRISHLSPEQREFLQTLSVLGPEFGTDQALAVLDGSARELAPLFATTQGVGLLAQHGTVTAFRNPLLQEQLYEEIPLPLRARLHTRAAERLEAAGAPLDPVLQQLTKAAAASDSYAPPGSWAHGWLHEHTEALVNRTPAVAVELLSPLVDPAAPGGPVHLAVLTALQRLQRHDEVEAHCRRLLDAAADPETIGQAGYQLAVCLQRGARFAEANDLTDRLFGRRDLPPKWRAALHAVRSTTEDNVGHQEAAEHHAELAITLGRSCEAWFAVGLGGWYSAQFAASADPHLALRRYDEAVDALRRDPSQRFMLTIALGGRLGPLHWLDRTADLADTVDSMRRLIGANGGVAPFVTTMVLAELRYHQGRWDELLADTEHLTEQSPAENWQLYTLHGMLAVVAAHRGDEAALRRHLDKCADMPQEEGYLLDFGQWTRLARAVAADRAGEPGRAVAALLEFHRPELMHHQRLRFHLLPHLVRFALAAGDRTTAADAARLCRAQAEPRPVTHWQQAAAHCAAMLADDAATLLDVAAYYQRTERPLEHAQTLQDAARAFTAVGDHQAAEAATAQAAAACHRLGIPGGVDAPAQQPDRGWESLTATEQRIARLAAQARSNPQIAAELNLPRRTVQTHVSRILTKLQLRSRVEIPLHVPADAR
ncbi:ATP-binding protein [Kitasatospora sp. NPDC001660]